MKDSTGIVGPDRLGGRTSESQRDEEGGRPGSRDKVTEVIK